MPFRFPVVQGCREQHHRCLPSNFKKLWEEGIGKLMLVYVIALFGFIIWIGLAISWIFFNGVLPPLVK